MCYTNGTRMLFLWQPMKPSTTSLSYEKQYESTPLWLISQSTLTDAHIWDWLDWYKLIWCHSGKVQNILTTYFKIYIVTSVCVPSSVDTDTKAAFTQAAKFRFFSSLIGLLTNQINSEKDWMWKDPMGLVKRPTRGKTVQNWTALMYTLMYTYVDNTS